MVARKDSASPVYSPPIYHRLRLTELTVTISEAEVWLPIIPALPARCRIPAIIVGVERCGLVVVEEEEEQVKVAVAK